jgi:hypothetical protein
MLEIAWNVYHIVWVCAAIYMKEEEQEQQQGALHYL